MQKPIKILFTIRQGSIGGGETYLFNLVSRLDRNKIEPVVLSFTDGEMVNKLKDAGIETRVFHTLKPFDFRMMVKVYRFIKEQCFDLVHMHGTRAATNTLLPALAAGIPALYTVHGWSFHTGNSKTVTLMRKISERFITKYSRVTVCGSESDIRTGKKEAGLKNPMLIHNSVDPESFLPGEKTGLLKESLGVSKTDTVIASIARVTFQKDPLTFISAAADALKKNSALKFLMIGDGELAGDARRKVPELNIADNFFFLPFSTNVSSMLAEIDIFVLPSLWEVVPLGLLEAMSSEKACIASNIPGTDEALVHNKNGLLFTAGRADELSDRMLELAGDAGLRIKLGAAARDTVLRNFNLSRLVKKNEELYFSVAELN